jgi:hypothetical protein
MSEKRTNWLWDKLRKRSREELDRLQKDLLKRPAEKRQYAGDPNQSRNIWVRTRNK